MAALLKLPQLTRFYALVRTAGVESIPGRDITVLAPTNDAFEAAEAAGVVKPEQLRDPAAARRLLLAHILPQGGLQSAALEQLGRVEDANNATVLVFRSPEGA